MFDEQPALGIGGFDARCVNAGRRTRGTSRVVRLKIGPERERGSSSRQRARSSIPTHRSRLSGASFPIPSLPPSLPLLFFQRCNRIARGAVVSRINPARAAETRLRGCRRGAGNHASRSRRFSPSLSRSARKSGKAKPPYEETEGRLARTRGARDDAAGSTDK